MHISLKISPDFYNHLTHTQFDVYFISIHPYLVFLKHSS